LTSVCLSEGLSRTEQWYQSTVKISTRRRFKTELTQRVYIAQNLPSETSESDDSNQLLKSPPSASLLSLHFSVCLSHIMSHGGRRNQGE